MTPCAVNGKGWCPRNVHTEEKAASLRVGERTGTGKYWKPHSIWGASAQATCPSNVWCPETSPQKCAATQQ